MFGRKPKPSVVIAGGGLAAIETALKLRRHAADRVDITLLCPNSHLSIRAYGVAAPFIDRAGQRVPIEDIVRYAGINWHRVSLSSVDPESMRLETSYGERLGFDQAVLAVGSRAISVYPYATTFDDARAAAVYGTVVRGIETKRIRSLVLIAPVGQVWPLPIYELALLTASRVREIGIDDFRLDVVIPEPEPLSAFGPQVSRMVSRLLAEAGVACHTSTLARVPRRGHVELRPSGVDLDADAIVAMPRLAGPRVSGIAETDHDGFIPTDRHGRVGTAASTLFAAGDAVRFPLKHGAISAQQADAVAASIASEYCAGVEPEEFRPIIRALVYTGARPLYIQTRITGHDEIESRASHDPLWEGGAKVAAEEVNRFINRSAPQAPYASLDRGFGKSGQDDGVDRAVVAP